MVTVCSLLADRLHCGGCRWNCSGRIQERIPHGLEGHHAKLDGQLRYQQSRPYRMG